MHFGENQLSRSLIGLSPLTTGHPPGFQPWWVRASTQSYPRFTLPMARSLRFGSWARDSTALFGLAFATATPHGLTSPHTANSQAHSSKGTQSRPASKLTNDAPTACRHTVSGTISLRSRGTFHHSLTVLSAIGHQGIFRLSGWSRQIHTGFLGPRATWEILKQVADISATGVLPSTPGLSHALRLHQQFLTHRPAGRPIKKAPTTPHAQPLPGIPIRTPPDQSSVDSSPGPIAASHVLHRFLVPRHPPCALKNLATDARVHYAVLKQRTLKGSNHHRS